jgi:hypothetical protein
MTRRVVLDILAISTRIFPLDWRVRDGPLLERILHTLAPKGMPDRNLVILDQMLGSPRTLGLAEGLCRLPDLLPQRFSVSVRRLQAPQTLFLPVNLGLLHLSKPFYSLGETPKGVV